MISTSNEDIFEKSIFGSIIKLSLIKYQLDFIINT